MTFGTYLANKILNKFLRAVDFSTDPVYLSLHSADPGSTGASELNSAGGYSRQQVNSAGWTAAASKNSDNVNAVAFASMPTVVVTHAGLWDAPSAGNFLIGGQVSAASVTAGQTFQFNAGHLHCVLV